MEQAVDIILKILGFVVLFILLKGLAAALIPAFTKAHGKARKNEVRVPIIAFFLGIVMVTLFGVPFLLAINQDKENAGIVMAFVILMAPLLSLGLAPILVYANYRIKYDETGFIYRNIWGIKRRYSFADVSGIIKYERSLKLIINDRKRLMIHECSMGVSDFIWAIGAWRKDNNISPKKLPKIKDPIFNDNVVDGGNFVVLWIMLVVGTGAMVLGCFVLSLPLIPITKTDMEGYIISGILWSPFVIIGPVYNYFACNAEKYPKIAKALIGENNIKNPVVREKLGLKPLKSKKK